MSRHVQDLESLLTGLIAEHRKMLVQVEDQQGAMRKFDLAAMDAAMGQQESIRLRITGLETRRRTLIAQMAIGLKLPELTLVKIAQLNPAHSVRLLPLRDELKAIAATVAQRTHVAGRVAGAILGHLNSAVRILAGAAQQAGLYTKHGTPQVAGRIGTLETVG